MIAIKSPHGLYPTDSQRNGYRTYCTYPLDLSKDIQQLLQLQQLVLVPGHPLQSPAQFLLPQAQQGQQGLLTTPNLIPLPQQNQGGLLSPPPRLSLPTQQHAHSQVSKCAESQSSSGGHTEEPSDLEELEQFARTFKQRRIKLGFTQTMSMDTTLPSPNHLSSPPLCGFEGLPGRRRKKRTSIETNVRVALERAFIAPAHGTIHPNPTPLLQPAHGMIHPNRTPLLQPAHVTTMSSGMGSLAQSVISSAPSPVTPPPNSTSISPHSHNPLGLPGMNPNTGSESAQSPPILGMGGVSASEGAGAKAE
ncbi:UNVERIFIED_CONTAM: hypothetical protein FKN15_058729 [Acipenser sinensis]